MSQIQRRALYILALVLLLPAFLINLGLLALIDDEGIRALVALEMQISGNYITPTLLGEYYYNKPPLYNWILLSFYELTGTINEFTTRFPTVLNLIGFAATVFYFFKKQFNTKIGFLTAFALITCGRIFFYDSLLGLIDISFSWVIFLLWMTLFHQYKKANWVQLFVLSYLLTSIAFLMKGLPAIVFQGFSLLALFIYHKNFKKLFSWQHLLGGLVFIILVGVYYAAYHQYNSLENVFTTLFTESSKRTVVNYGWEATVQHFFTFPFEQIYHFLPWSLLVIYLFNNNALTTIRKNEFISFCALMFLVNIPIYWTSVQVYPRYLLMFPPLVFGPLIYLMEENKSSWQTKSLEILFMIAAIAVALLSWTPLFWDRVADTPFLIPKTLFLGVSLSVLTLTYIKIKPNRLITFVSIMLVFRIGFNWFVLPDRNANDWGDNVRKSTIKLAKETKDLNLLVYEGTKVQPANAFYLTNERKKIVPVGKEPSSPDNLYLLDRTQKPRHLYFKKLTSFKVRHGEPKFLEAGYLHPK